MVEKEVSVSVKILKDLLDSNFFKMFSEPVRTKILVFLLENGKSDVGTIASFLPQDRSVVSRHLSKMHKSGVLIASRQDRHHYYSVNSDFMINTLRNLVFNTSICAGTDCNCCNLCPNYETCLKRSKP
ncbi:ArsR family transcriptional regulator [Myxococcota bacterium]|nr:ArsR family transcriptional regulator [Myxococcota bacterium]MBU1382361.1 ArsR family transcriptional regulator [Myxococcota bacterium]MBU1498698.1 ArsR family transcriptional regulator [Myxococcota bacterium]